MFLLTVEIADVRSVIRELGIVSLLCILLVARLRIISVGRLFRES